MLIHNVHDNHRQWIGSWQAAPLVVSQLTPADVGRDVIYFAPRSRPEVGKLSSWRGDTVWARYHQGDTAAAASVFDVLLGVRPLDGPGQEANA